MREVWSGVSSGKPSNLIATKWPFDSTCGGRPGEKIRSLTPLIAFTMPATRLAVTVGLGGFGYSSIPVVRHGDGFPTQIRNPPYGRRITGISRHSSPQVSISAREDSARHLTG